MDVVPSIGVLEDEGSFIMKLDRFHRLYSITSGRCK